MAVDESSSVLSRARALIRRITAWALRLSVVRAFLHYSAHRGSMLADSVTYRALFSVFAAILLLFSAAALWLSGNPEALKSLTEAIDSFVPGIMDTVDLGDAQASSTGFTVVGVISLLGLVGAALSAIGSLRIAIRVIADSVAESTFFLWVLLRNAVVGLCFGALLLVAAAASLLTSSGASMVAGWLGTSDQGALLHWGTRLVGLVIALGINTSAIAVVFRLLSGMRPSTKSLWTGAIVGGIGLLILQEFSGLFVRGATSNPLLASFAALIALLLWINLSTQVILISASLIVTLHLQSQDRVREKFGSETMVQHRRRLAESELERATRELRAAQEAEREERQSL